MLAQLAELERQNTADSLMTNDSLALDLVAYFDRHGTPNERVRAHYILGRTHTDLGEAPAALDAYLDAIDCADTTAQDCDWGKLSRVYSQMASVYYNQNLHQDYIDACRFSVDCAWKAADTIQALRESILQLAGFDRQGQLDSVIIKAKPLFTTFADGEYAGLLAQYAVIPVRSFLESGLLEDADYFLDLYENTSGYVDSTGQVLPGMEAYYFYRGLYYTYSEQYDLAEYYFRKELADGVDVDNQNMGSYGLAKLFSRTGRADTAVHYALYSYAMNDSCYNQAAMADMERMKALYSYSRHQQIAIEEHERASKEQKEKMHLYLVLVLLLSASVVVFLVLRRKKKENSKLYQQKLDELIQTNKELQLMQVQKESLESQITDKEDIIKQLLQELDLLKLHEAQFGKLIVDKEAIITQKSKELEVIQNHRGKLLQQIEEYKELFESLQTEAKHIKQDDLLTESLAEAKLAKSPVYKQIERLANAPRKFSDEEWVVVENLIKDMFPKFYSFLLAHKAGFTNYEYQICLLLRLHVRMKQAAAFIGIAKSQVSTISTGILAQVFHESGSGKELKRRLENMF
ncbi:MAG: hypothetical protein IJ570_02105 [Prevotella sp.]|nr:hypothetical protein [Prevotella sp.]